MNHHHDITTWLDRLMGIPGDFWNVLTEMAPFLLFGFLMAGVLSVLISPRLVERHLGKRGFLSTLKAALFGVPLPLCSCSVIPVAMSLRRHGASRGATTAFLISAPETGVDSILVTYSLLGLVFAIYRPVAALVSGLVGGIVVDLLDRDKPAGPNGGGAGGDADGNHCQDTCCIPNAHGAIYRALFYAFVTLPRDIGRSLLIGVAIAALISTLLPPTFFTETLGGVLGGGVLGIVIMMLLGVPVYVCATASVPIAAVLIAKGVSPGAALAFLMTGPATNAATIVTVWKVMGARTGLAYVASIAGTALAAGLMLDYVFSFPGVTASVPEAHEMLPAWLNVASAVIVLSMLIWAVIRPSRSEPQANPEGGRGPALVLRVGGMTCGHCAQSVRKALLACPGVRDAAVDLSAGTATVSGTALDVSALNAAVRAAGYNSEAGGELSPGSRGG